MLKFPKELGFLALRARPDGPLAGFLNHRWDVEAVAVRHLGMKIRHGAKGVSRPKITLVLEPHWKPGETLVSPKNRRGTPEVD